MAFDTPDFSNDLKNMLRQQNPMMPGQPQGAPPTGMPGIPNSGVPFASGAPGAASSIFGARPTVPTATGSAPAPTDDPAVLGQVQKPPDMMSYLNPAMTRYNEDMAGYRTADEAHRVDPNALKPKLWERIVGGLLGATQFGNPQAAYELANNFAHRDLNRATRARTAAMAPWTQRLQADREGLEPAKDAAEVAGKQATLNLETDRENRERYTAKANADYKSDIAQIRSDMAANNLDMAQKRLDETAEKNKNDNDRRRELDDIRDRLATVREQQIAKGKDHSAQSASAETQKANSLKSAHAAYVKATQGLPTDPKAPWTDEQLGQLQQAKDALSESQQEAEDAYEAKASELAGHAVPHQDVTKDWGKGKSAAPAGAPAGKPAAGQSEVPTAVGPEGEKPMKTATDGQGKKLGFYKSTGQWMLLAPEKKQ